MYKVEWKDKNWGGSEAASGLGRGGEGAHGGLEPKATSGRAQGDGDTEGGAIPDRSRIAPQGRCREAWVGLPPTGGTGGGSDREEEGRGGKIREEKRKSTCGSAQRGTKRATATKNRLLAYFLSACVYAGTKQCATVRRDGE